MTPYINTDTMQYPVYQYQIEQEYPYTKPTNPFQPPPFFAPVMYSPTPQYNWIYQGVRELTPEERDGQWYQVFEVYELSPEQIAANEEQARQNNKNQATQFLSQTDWTATVGINDPAVSDPYLENQAEFLAYRSQVRAIAVNPPIVVDSWPTAPVEVWSGTPFVSMQDAVVEEPVVETPVVETPVVETPVVETPVVETPVVETPVVEEPVLTTPEPTTPEPTTPNA